MSVKQIKILLIEKGLTIAEIAREFHKDSNATFRSVETMVSDTLYGKRFYPSIAARLKNTYDITIERPNHYQPVRQKLKQGA